MVADECQPHDGAEYEALHPVRAILKQTLALPFGVASSGVEDASNAGVISKVPHNPRHEDEERHDDENGRAGTDNDSYLHKVCHEQPIAAATESADAIGVEDMLKWPPVHGLGTCA